MNKPQDSAREVPSTPRVAIVGATGAVGRELLELLQERDFPLESLTLYSSARSAGKRLPFGDSELELTELPEHGDLEADIVFSSAGSRVSSAAAWDWAAHGATVVDNTSAWRMDERVPLVVPEVNADAIRGHRGIIANPNCSIIVALMALAPLHRAFGLRRATIATYQAVSGAGAAGIDELREQSRATLAGEPLRREKFAHPIAFNLFSHDSDVGMDGYNDEETKMRLEARKILGLPGLKLSATCVRVPVFRAHSEAIHAEFDVPVTAGMAREQLAAAPGVRLVDDRDANTFPMPLSASGKDDILVGRLRDDTSLDGGLAFFLAGDQIRKGAALNSVQIAEQLLH